MMKTETKQNTDLRHKFMRSPCVPSVHFGLAQLLCLGMTQLQTLQFTDTNI